ncbi:MAG TPA: DHHA1 domain-containing protein, partial [Candidatus Acidoferrales bacterium]|nr:DHHA1 domain-containing protein [Candidatus Acidoferrales bacterium]
DDYDLITDELPYDRAVATGAIAMAGEKYGELVRVVRAGPSVEFCGGTHAHSTGELGMFVILSEASIGSGVRRIEAIVSRAAEAYVGRQQDLVGSLCESLSARPDELVERIERLHGELREVRAELGTIKARMAAADAQAYVQGASDVGGKPLVAAIVHEADAEALKSLGTAIRSRFKRGVIALVGVDGDAVSVLVTASDDLVKAGVHAGNLVKAAVAKVDGKGGGAPAQAQGGGKNPAGAEAALAAIRAALAA